MNQIKIDLLNDVICTIMQIKIVVYKGTLIDKSVLAMKNLK